MPIFAYDIWPDGRAEPAADLAATGSGAWRWLHFDLADPELGPWVREHLPEIPGAALLHAETRPRCDAFNDGLILNLRAVNLNPGQPADLMVSVRMWVTERTVVTVRRMRVFTTDEIGRDCAEGRAPASVGAFLVTLVQRLARRVHDVVLELDRVTEEYELQYEDTDTAPDAADLKEPRKQVIRMLRYLTPQGKALDRLLAADSPVLAQDHRIALREPEHLIELSLEVLLSLKARLEALHEASHAAITAELARNNYVLSVVAVVFLPLGFLAGLFGANVGGIPGASSVFGFAILCAAITGVAGVSLAVLKWLRML